MFSSRQYVRITQLKPSHEWNLENYGKLLVNNIILKRYVTMTLLKPSQAMEFGDLWKTACE